MSQQGDSIAIQRIDNIHPKLEQSAAKQKDSGERPDSVQRADSAVDSTWSAHAVMLFADPDPLYPPEERGTDTLQGASWLILALLVLLVAIGLKFRYSARYLGVLVHEITNTRRRHNLFDDTVRENSFLLLLNTVTLLSGALLLCFYLLDGANPTLPQAAACMGLGLIYGLFMYLAYSLTGWVFSDHATMKIWVRGHTSATALLSIVMLPLALAVTTDATIAPTATLVALGAFLVAKLLFVFKGIRIFFAGPTSIFLFFYYLCSLEIVPLVIVCATARIILRAVA